MVERIVRYRTPERVGSRATVDDHAPYRCVLCRRATVVERLDVQSAVLSADPNFYTPRPAVAGGTRTDGGTVG